METIDRTELQALIDSLELEYSAVFVPWSQSRNVKPKPKVSDYNLNWRITLSKGGRTLTTDYMEGIGHIPGYKHESRLTVEGFDDIKRSCETGSVAQGPIFRKPIPRPDLKNILYSLVLDYDAIDHPTFEDWAAESGYDTDSREAERIYKACLDTGLKLRAMIGDENIDRLREAFQDY